MLTKREREVAALLGSGKSNKQIGAELGISVQTAKFHVANVALKLDSSTRTEAAVKYALMIERTRQGAQLVMSAVL